MTRGRRPLWPWTVLFMVFTLAAPSAAFKPNLFFNVTVTDMSPVVLWNPRNVFGNSTIWVASLESFSSGDWVRGTYVPPGLGFGDTRHTTSSMRGRVAIHFIGIAIYLQGLVIRQSSSLLETNDWSVDGVRQPNDKVTDIGVYATGLEWGGHYAMGGLAFDEPGLSLLMNGAMVTTGMWTQAPRLSEVEKTTVPFVIDGAANPAINFTGNWEVQTEMPGYATQKSFPYAAMNGAEDSTTTLTIPTNTSYLVLNGTNGPFGRPFTLDWYPAPPPGTNDSALTVIPVDTWVVAGTTLYMTPLDPQIEYKLTLSAPADSRFPSTAYMGLHSAVYYSALWNGTYTDRQDDEIATQHKSNKGALIGGLVGGIFGALAIAVGLWFCMRRRRQRATKEELFEVDEDAMATYARRSSSRSAADSHPPSPPVTHEKPQLMHESSFSSMSDGGTGPTAMTWVTAHSEQAQASGSSQPPSPRGATSRIRHVQETDAGTADTSEEDETVEYVPPSYDPRWARVPSNVRVVSTPISSPLNSPGLSPPLSSPGLGSLRESPFATGEEVSELERDLKWSEEPAAPLSRWRAEKAQRAPPSDQSNDTT